MKVDIIIEYGFKMIPWVPECAADPTAAMACRALGCTPDRLWLLDTEMGDGDEEWLDRWDEIVEKVVLEHTLIGPEGALDGVRVYVTNDHGYGVIWTVGPSRFEEE